MVAADYRLLTQHLGVKHLRLVMGTSMGAMHTWVLGEMYPDFMDGADASGQRASADRRTQPPAARHDHGRHPSDPDIKNGDYDHPIHGLRAAQYGLTVMTSSPLQMQKQWPTRDKADAAYEHLMETAMDKDANDMLYQFASSTDYNPEPDLEKIKARLIAVNSADDEVNPPELGILDRDIKRVKHGRYVLIPTSPRDPRPRNAFRRKAVEAVCGGVVGRTRLELIRSAPLIPIAARESGHVHHCEPFGEVTDHGGPVPPQARRQAL